MASILGLLLFERVSLSRRAHQTRSQPHPARPDRNRVCAHTPQEATRTPKGAGARPLPLSDRPEIGHGDPPRQDPQHIRGRRRQPQLPLHRVQTPPGEPAQPPPILEPTHSWTRSSEPDADTPGSLPGSATDDSSPDAHSPRPAAGLRPAQQRPACPSCDAAHQESADQDPPTPGSPPSHSPHPPEPDPPSYPCAPPGAPPRTRHH